jgi:hypothetical protein
VRQQWFRAAAPYDENRAHGSQGQYESRPHLTLYVARRTGGPGIGRGLAALAPGSTAFADAAGLWQLESE